MDAVLVIVVTLAPGFTAERLGNSSPGFQILLSPSSTIENGDIRW